MLQITPKHRVFVCIKPVDFRCGIDGLVAICRNQLQASPMSGHIFVFRNRRGHAIKLIVYDGQGFWLCHKRLSTGYFKHWPKHPGSMIKLDVAQLQALIYNANPAHLGVEFFKPLVDE